MKKKLRIRGNTSKVKGRLVEQIVAALHRSPGVSVQTNVKLRPVGNPKGRAREIDVLLEGGLAGYPIQIAIECKNEKGKVGAPKIDAFIGKLKDVGIPAQQGVYVAVTGFTRDALRRARDAGVKTLILEGLTQERLEQAVYEAVRSTVYLVPTVTQWMVQNEIGEMQDPTELGLFYDESGKVRGFFADLVWSAWEQERIPGIVGEHKVRLELPKGWHHVIDGQKSVPSLLEATVKVTATAVSEHGSAAVQSLREAGTGAVEKLSVNAKFSVGEEPVEVVEFVNQSALDGFLNEAGSRFTIRALVRLPKVMWYGVWWPPSLRLINNMNNYYRTRGTGGHSAPPDLSSFDPPTFAKVWKPVVNAQLRNGDTMLVAVSPEELTDLVRQGRVKPSPPE